MKFQEIKYHPAPKDHVLNLNLNETEFWLLDMYIKVGSAARIVDGMAFSAALEGIHTISQLSFEANSADIINAECTLFHKLNLLASTTTCMCHGLLNEDRGTEEPFKLFNSFKEFEESMDGEDTRKAGEV